MDAIVDIRQRAVIVEDDPDVRTLLTGLLEDEGFDVLALADGDGVRALCEQVDPAVVLLDLGLGDVSGLDVLVDLRSRHDVAVIVVSGESQATTRVSCLDAGADDYVTKPFLPEELAARVRSVLRRRPEPGERLVLGELEIDNLRRQVTCKGQPVVLTVKEYDLLHAMARPPHRPWSREELLAEVWNSRPEWQSLATVTEHVRRVRRKLRHFDDHEWIETVHGVGYRLVSPAER